MKVSRALVSLFLVVIIVLPIGVSAVTLVPFGGIVTATIPCHVGPTPSLWVNVLGFSFIYTATTIPFAWYVPLPGSYILGLADIPMTCFVGLVPLPPGLRIQMFGTSPAIPKGAPAAPDASAAASGHGLY